jgi:hypothetical protein
VKRFVVPPNWPTPPRRSWVPPKTWRPDPSWPPAPDGWRFWDDGKGNPVRGPVGRYGGPSRRTVIAGAGGIALFLAVNLWALNAIGLFDHQQPRPQAAKLVDDSTPGPSITPTPTSTPTPTTLPSAPPPVQKTTVKPSTVPTRTRTTKKVQRSEEQSPVPTKTATKTVKPNRPTTPRPPTREEIIREYCRQQGYDPDWCNPDNWPPDPNGPGQP